jgi:hypothetical protein
MVMPRIFLKYIVALLLMVVSGNFAHSLADGLAGDASKGSCAAVLTSSGDEGGNPHGHSHSNGMSCYQWLCTCCGFLGVVEAGAAGVTNVQASNQVFACIADERLSSRTIEPPLDPPRAYSKG